MKSTGKKDNTANKTKPEQTRTTPRHHDCRSPTLRQPDQAPVARRRCNTSPILLPLASNSEDRRYREGQPCPRAPLPPTPSRTPQGRRGSAGDKREGSRFKHGFWALEWLLRGGARRRSCRVPTRTGSVAATGFSSHNLAATCRPSTFARFPMEVQGNHERKAVMSLAPEPPKVPSLTRLWR
ncbi:uncharacterized protein BKA78DRAFT_192709 [Phyllosticta capitalensis]|uniref:uncharacterized protein n=1 Tax=Phyllosticta capitalensis TaxID=121624 RepID=UPI00312EB986